MYPIDSVKNFMKSIPTDKDINKHLGKAFIRLLKRELGNIVVHTDNEIPFPVIHNSRTGDITVRQTIEWKGHRLRFTAYRINDTKELYVEDLSQFTADGNPRIKFDYKSKQTLADCLIKNGFYKTTDEDKSKTDRTKIPLKLYEVRLEDVGFGFVSALIACESEDMLKGLLASHVFVEKHTDRIEYMENFYTTTIKECGEDDDAVRIQCVEWVKYICDCSLRSSKEAIVVHAGQFRE